MSDEANSEYDDTPFERVGEVKTICRAVRERWPLTDAARAKAVATLNEFVASGKSSSVRIKAIRALALLDNINLKAKEEQKPPQLHLHANVNNDAMPVDELRTRLAAISARLGIGEMAIDGSARNAAANLEGTGGT